MSARSSIELRLLLDLESFDSAEASVRLRLSEADLELRPASVNRIRVEVSLHDEDLDAGLVSMAEKDAGEMYEVKITTEEVRPLSENDVFQVNSLFS